MRRRDARAAAWRAEGRPRARGAGRPRGAVSHSPFRAIVSERAARCNGAASSASLRRARPTRSPLCARVCRPPDPEASCCATRAFPIQSPDGGSSPRTRYTVSLPETASDRNYVEWLHQRRSLLSAAAPSRPSAAGGGDRRAHQRGLSSLVRGPSAWIRKGRGRRLGRCGGRDRVRRSADWPRLVG